jgi:hypothetical protein
MSRRGTGSPQWRRPPEEPRPSRRRTIAVGAIAAVVLAVGGVLAFGDFFGRPDGTASAKPVRMSMAGFEPQVITARAGEELSLELWTTDAAPHLEGGVHTLISDELGIYVELPADSRRSVSLQMPTEPGTYDIYCDTCCGGKQSPTMHGQLRVQA